jgi:hypothetical protein
MKLDDKKIPYLAIPVLLILLGVGFYFFNRGRVKTQSEVKTMPTSEIIPTVDGSVKVDLAMTSQGKEVILKVQKIPAETESIDYELSYKTKAQGLQGIIGTITLTEGEREYQKKLTLGTCSSGTCVYHQVVGSINLTLRFMGGYGERIFEKEYEL